MAYDTVRRTCLKFTAVGMSLDALTTKKPRNFKKIPDVIKTALLSQQILQAWNAYSLIERVKIMRERWGVSISENTLCYFYKQHGCTYRTGQAVYRTEMGRTRELKTKRAVFARLLAGLIQSNK